MRSCERSSVSSAMLVRNIRVLLGKGAPSAPHCGQPRWRHVISTSTEARLVAQSSALWHIAHALCWSSDGTRGSSRLSCTKLHPTSSAWRDACDGQPAEQEADRRELDQRLARLDLAQVILGQSAVCRKPSETPLHDPAARLHTEPVCATRCSTISRSQPRSRCLHQSASSLPR